MGTYLGINYRVRVCTPAGGRVCRTMVFRRAAGRILAGTSILGADGAGLVGVDLRLLAFSESYPLRRRPLQRLASRYAPFLVPCGRPSCMGGESIASDGLDCALVRL